MRVAVRVLFLTLAHGLRSDVSHLSSDFSAKEAAHSTESAAHCEVKTQYASIASHVKACKMFGETICAHSQASKYCRWVPAGFRVKPGECWIVEGGKHTHGWEYAYHCRYLEEEKCKSTDFCTWKPEKLEEIP
eukprot:Skav228713  [mRNA]  locus=scaffold928:19631:20029:- [translate_table: standard]